MTDAWIADASIADACTLPTAERPLRSAEFDRLFARTLAVEPRGPGRLRLVLPADGADEVHDLIARESACCSFFDFTVTPDGADRITLDISVPAPKTAVLSALAERATARRPA